MAKFCSNCGKELDEKADICLNCGVLVNKEVSKNISSNVNNGKKKGLPTWAIVLIIVGCVLLIPLIIIVLLGVLVFNVVKDEDSKYLDDARNYFNEYMEDYEVVSEGTIGDTLEIDGVKFTLNNALKYSSIGDSTYSNALKYSSIGDSTYSNTPGDGNEYLVFFFDVENISDVDKLVTYLNFKGSVDEEEKMPTFVFSEIDGVSNLNKTLSSKEKVMGYVAFEVDKEWNDFNLYYGELFGKEKIVFYVTNEKNSNSDEL